MLQKFKIIFYTLIVLFVLSGFSNQDVGIDKFIAPSCKGWNCTYEGQVCPLGSEGASDQSFICRNSKWVPILADSCKGWNCDVEGQLCPQGADGASGTSFICLDSKWVPTNCEMRDDDADYEGGLLTFAFFHKKSIAQSVDDMGRALCVGGGVVKRK
jgi:hypothetical protein